MGFCSFSKEYTQSMYTIVENQFITKYLPLADANSIKVYLFGLYLCQNSTNSFTLEDMARELQMTVTEIEQSFLFWEDFDLLKILSKQPFCVQYYPVNFAKGKPKKLQVNKYADFTKALQALFPNRMISSTEYAKYFAFMEENSMQPDAMLLIINYCISIKNKDIKSSYILQVAKNWIADDIRTVRQIEDKLENYTLNTINMQKILAVMQPKSPPNEADVLLLKKWTESYKFTMDCILQLIAMQKITTFTKLDTLLTELFHLNLIDWQAIEKHLNAVQKNRQLTTQLAKTLGVYCQNIDTYTENFTKKWKQLGYTDTQLLELAKFAFQNHQKSFEEMQILIDTLYIQNIRDTESLIRFYKDEEQDVLFLKKILTACGITKSPTVWHKQQLKVWRSWGFNDKLLLKAASLSFGKSNTLTYLNGILSNWKEQNLFTLHAVEEIAATTYTPLKTTADRDKELHKIIEQQYFTLREKAIAQAEYYQKKVERIAGYRELERQIKTLEITYSKAVALQQINATELCKELQKLEKKRSKLFLQHKIDSKKLQPNYSCSICNDTGFDKNSHYCKCYIEKLEKLKNST